MFKVVNEPENYEALYRALLSEFADTHIDKSTKDICRVCYESYDPELYVNENAKEWRKYEVEDITEIGKNIISITVPLKSESRILDILQKWFDKKYQMSEGNRNSNIFTFAIALNQFGINQYTGEQIDGIEYLPGDDSPIDKDSLNQNNPPPFTGDDGTALSGSRYVPLQVVTSVKIGRAHV